MDIQFLQSFAQTNRLNLTAPLSNTHVDRLAHHWLPDIFFHWKEKYFPISLEEAIGMVEAQFDRFPDAARDAWRLRRWVQEDTVAVSRLFDPPLVTVPKGLVRTDSSGDTVAPTVRVISDEMPVRRALEDSEVAGDTRITHGGSDFRSDQFFGSLFTVSRATHPSVGDPFVPRTLEVDDVPRITVMATYKNLLETLEYNLLAKAESDYPPDALRTGYDIEGLLIRPVEDNVILSDETRRDALLALIAAHKAGNPLPDLPPHIELDKVAWDTLTRYAFLEYYLFYAYNDFERYQTAIFDNEHEGDDEGFCLVFDRNVINAAFLSPNADTLLSVPPHSIITSVHEEYQGGDEFRLVPTPPLPAESPEELREELALTVWVAGGSHATYLSQGTHDLVDFGDYIAWVNENAAWAWIVLTPPGLIALAIVMEMIEHFVDTEDFTSDDGTHTGPSTDPSDPTGVNNRVQILPMSAGDHIYQDRALLRLAAFPGLWGGSDGFVDKSPPFTPKTGRYFRKLLSQV